MKIKKKILLTVLLLFCVSITPIILAEEVNAAKNYEHQVLDLVNEERAKAGIAPLKMDKELFDCAQIRSQELVTLFSHTRPDGKSYSTITKKTVGENIAAGQTTPKSVMDTWMNSQGHRANILDSRYKSIGIGYFKSTSGYGHYWVQLLAFNEVEEEVEPTYTTDTSDSPNQNNNTQQNNNQQNNTQQNNNQQTTTQQNDDKTVEKPSTPSFTLDSAVKKITIKWKKISKASGYQIYKSTKKNGKYVLKKTITKGSIIQYIDKKLKKKQKYYYKIRSYIKINGKKIYSKFSSIKSKTTK